MPIFAVFLILKSREGPATRKPRSPSESLPMFSRARMGTSTDQKSQKSSRPLGRLLIAPFSPDAYFGGNLETPLLSAAKRQRHVGALLPGEVVSGILGLER
ncbi:MAG: hypothetical protein WEB50_14370 [Vicinamibacterales bacterium]